MLTAVDFISQADFEAVAPVADLAVVSIGDPAGTPPCGLWRHNKVLRLEFLDCEREDAARLDLPPEVLFTELQLHEFADYVLDLHAQNAACRLVVHCRMGASRSAALALIAQALTGCETPRRAEANYANTHVLLLAKEVLGLAVEPPPAPDMNHYIYLPGSLAI